MFSDLNMNVVCCFKVLTANNGPVSSLCKSHCLCCSAVEELHVQQSREDPELHSRLRVGLLLLRQRLKGKKIKPRLLLTFWAETEVRINSVFQLITLLLLLSWFTLTSETQSGQACQQHCQSIKKYSRLVLYFILFIICFVLCFYLPIHPSIFSFIYLFYVIFYQSPQM